MHSQTKSDMAGTKPRRRNVLTGFIQDDTLCDCANYMILYKAQCGVINRSLLAPRMLLTVRDSYAPFPLA